jgi:hypothetical protein
LLYNYTYLIYIHANIVIILFMERKNLSDVKKKLSDTLYKIRNPEYDEHEKEFRKDLNYKRLLIMLPFIIAAIIFMLLSWK